MGYRLEVDGGRGLGSGNLRFKNEALLANWLWHFSLEPNGFWHRIIVSKYEFLLIGSQPVVLLSLVNAPGRLYLLLSLFPCSLSHAPLGMIHLLILGGLLGG